MHKNLYLNTRTSLIITEKVHSISLLCLPLCSSPCLFDAVLHSQDLFVMIILNIQLILQCTCTATAWNLSRLGCCWVLEQWPTHAQEPLQPCHPSRAFGIAVEVLRLLPKDTRS